MGSKTGHGFWYTVGAFEVTHNHITKTVDLPVQYVTSLTYPLRDVSNYRKFPLIWILFASWVGAIDLCSNFKKNFHSITWTIYMPSPWSAQKESATGTNSVVVWTGIQCWCTIICPMINEANCPLMQNVNHASLRLYHLPSLRVDDADCLVWEGFRSNHLFQKEQFFSEGIIVSEGTILHECRYEHWFSILHHCRVTVAAVISHWL